MLNKYFLSTLILIWSFFVFIAISLGEYDWLSVPSLFSWLYVCLLVEWNHKEALKSSKRELLGDSWSIKDELEIELEGPASKLSLRIGFYGAILFFVYIIWSSGVGSERSSAFKECHDYKAVASYDEALMYCKTAANLGSVRAMVNLGDIYKSRGSSEDYTEALEWYGKAAQVPPSAKASNLVWFICSTLSKSKATAITDAITALAGMYYNGEGVSKNDKQAFIYYKRAAELGHDYSMFSLGVMYYNGYGILRDPQRAKFWMKKAYEAGNDQALREWNRLELWQY